MTKSVMLTLGLTGSIGMGKTTVAGFFAAQNVPVFDADWAVHELYLPGGEGMKKISEYFPTAIDETGAVDRQKLSALILDDPSRIEQIEEVIHPLVGKMREKFVDRAITENRPMVVFDVPLLFENGHENSVDIIIVVSAPFEVQQERVLNRPGMTKEKFKAILDMQIPDEEKRRRAHYVIDTNRPLIETQTQVKDIIAQIKQQ